MPVRASLRIIAAAAALLAAAHCAHAAPGTRPDLRVESVSLSRGVAHLGEVVEATVTLRNLGDVGVNHATVRLHLGGRRVGQDYLVDLGPGASVDISTEFFARPEGKHEFRVEIDPDNEIAEGDENNNRAQRTLGILSLPRELSRAPANGQPAQAQPALSAIPVPDLSVQDLSAAPQPVEPGAPVALRATVHNSGERALNDVVVRFLANGRPLGADQRVDVPADGVAVATAIYRPRGASTTAVSVAIDPAQRLTESTRSNNTRSLSIVAAAAATDAAQPAPSGPQPADAAPAQGTAQRPNLVCSVETILGVHYFDGERLRVTISNVAQSARASPFMLGLREAGGKGWIVRMPVRGVKAGEQLTVELPWPHETPVSAATRYEVMADVDDDVAETDERGDNLAGPFSLVVVAGSGEPQPGAAPVPAPTPPSLQLTAPAPGTTLETGRVYRIEWQSKGPVGDSVQLALIDGGSRRVMIEPDARNDGRMEWTVPPLQPGQWWLSVRSADGAVQSRHGPYTVSASRLSGVDIVFPEPGTALFAGETYTLAWRVAGPPDATDRLRLRLRDLRTGEVQPALQDVDVEADIGRYVWTVPEQPLLFGRYGLEALRADGEVVGRSAPFEINPAFVTRPRSYDPAQIDRRIRADLTVSGAGFDEGFFAFTVRNEGPENLPSDVAPAVRLRTYFIRRLPVRSAADYVVCGRSLYGWLDAGADQRVELGRDPDCPLGTRSEDQRFEFAVVRIEAPPVIGTLIDDPDPLNNARRAAFE